MVLGVDLSSGWLIGVVVDEWPECHGCDGIEVNNDRSELTLRNDNTARFRAACLDRTRCASLSVEAEDSHVTPVNATNLLRGATWCLSMLIRAGALGILSSSLPIGAATLRNL